MRTFQKLTRGEQSLILGGALLQCSATASCGPMQPNVTCNCEGSGSCSQGDKKVTCTCEGETANTVECPIVGG
jgi:hypothetical protein